ncbi:hypothetical protein SFC79_11300 [Nocardioides sp. S-58]|uniref:Uncharacterized protein n=1 Tax=Nocardioides renjunii TaxID=3095075 RepID=A0ABU5KBT6_9ACTN|nr:hypothetical protein [Nocardioides sp. S-58]MDZ5662351.1 hypothetical protein [Nocardioides sp. S-58]
MTSGVSASLFDFIDELADGIRQEVLDREDLVEQDSTAMTFCESFFDQFFGAIGVKITGFGRPEKELAGTHVEILRLDSGRDTSHVRLLIALYEGFCDMYDDLQSDYGAEVVALTYEIFHTDYLTELLEAAQSWAEVEGPESLADRIRNARAEYHDAIENSAWMTRTRKSESAWWRRT